MLKPNETKTALRNETERLRQEFLASGGKCLKLDPGVSQGLSKRKYIRRALKGVVSPLGSGK